MKKKIIAMTLETKADSQQQFCFDTTVLSEVLSELNFVYDEVFIWSAQNYLAVWAVGDNSISLARTFAPYSPAFENTEVYEGMAAQQLFRKITEGKMWDNVSAVKKLDTLQYAYELTQEKNGLGPMLFPFVSGSLSFLRTHSIIYGSRNSWDYQADKNSEDAVAPFINIKSKDVFYRFSIN